MRGPIVLGYDGSEGANAALRETIALAKETGANVVVVFAYYISPLGGGDMHDYKEALEKVGRHEVSRAVADLESEDVTVSTRIVSGKAADAIMDVAREESASMIVVGTEGESPIAGAVLGSVVLKLVQRSPVPLLVVPAPGS